MIYNCEYRGISIGSATSSTLIYNNTVVDCGVGIEEDPNDAILYNNIMVGNTTDTDVSNITNTHYNNATSEASAPWSTDGLLNVATSIFVDYANDTFLLASSTVDCVNDGIDGSAVVIEEDDIVGTSRPQGTAWDIGAFEVVISAGEDYPQIIIISSRYLPIRYSSIWNRED